jgi:hypothetical protein
MIDLLSIVARFQPPVRCAPMPRFPPPVVAFALSADSQQRPSPPIRTCNNPFHASPPRFSFLIPPQENSIT